MAVEEQVAASLKAAAMPVEAGQERHDSLVKTQDKPLRSVLDALGACTEEYKRDRFWADLAKPIDKAIEKLREEEAELAAGEYDKAAEARKVAMMLLEHHDEQMQAAAAAGHLFVNESKMVKMVHDAFKWDGTLTLASPLNSMAQATMAMQKEGAKERQYHAQNNQDRLEKVRSAMKPYTFEHTADHQEMTVKVPVPPATASRDVKCKVTRDTIRVSVQGHAKQPAVIDGKLQHPVDPEAFDWHLEGKGEERTLVLDLEKVSGGIDWYDLLQVGSAGQLV
uniref:CS domain-containing protein n=1 Tax=Prymnesium polylepis TaxID=72548 RepID=A0A6V4G6C6_9EUKA